MRGQHRPSLACVWGALLLLACSASPLPAGQKTAEVEPSFAHLEREIVAEVNRLRADPNGYAAKLKAWRPVDDGHDTSKETQQDWPALGEAISVLRSTHRMAALSVSKGLTRAARDHVTDQGPSGQEGHYGTDGLDPSARVRRYIPDRALLAENISYGRWTAEDLVLDELVDEGMADRGHRKNLLNGDFRNIGVACGKHAKYGIMCVLDFTSEF